MSFIKIGTCSWKYESWRGIIYSDDPAINYLKEYSTRYNTVEVDQWFWSLFNGSIKLPGSEVSEYKKSVPSDFLFTIKVPNAITLTHAYRSADPNPYFLSAGLFEQFLETLKPINENIGCLIFQFEYMNKQKMESLQVFQSRLQQLCSILPKVCPPVAIEIRNPNYLNEAYFRALNDMNFSHVFLEGYFMPSVSDIYSKYKHLIKNLTLIRLHGPDREGIGKLSGENWNKIYINRDAHLIKIRDMITDLRNRDVNLYINVNNHYEGSAPLTIKKIQNLID